MFQKIPLTDTLYRNIPKAQYVHIEIYKITILKKKFLYYLYLFFYIRINDNHLYKYILFCYLKHNELNIYRILIIFMRHFL